MQLNQPNLKQFIMYKEAFKKTAKYDKQFFQPYSSFMILKGMCYIYKCILIEIHNCVACLLRVLEHYNKMKT